MIMIMEDKTFFQPGNVVKLKQVIAFTPKMIVKSIDKVTQRNDSRSTFLGVTCFWFTSEGRYQEQRFNTKDLEILCGNE